MQVLLFKDIALFHTIVTGPYTQETLTQYPSYKAFVELDTWIQLTNSCMYFRLNEVVGCLTSELKALTDPGISEEISYTDSYRSCIYYT